MICILVRMAQDAMFFVVVEGGARSGLSKSTSYFRESFGLEDLESRGL